MRFHPDLLGGPSRPPQPDPPWASSGPPPLSALPSSPCLRTGCSCLAGLLSPRRAQLLLHPGEPLARLAALPSSVLPRASCLPLLRQAVVRATSTVVSPSRSLCTCHVGSLKPETGQHVCDGGCEDQMCRHPLFAEVSSLPLHLPDSWRLPHFTSTWLLPPFNRLSSLSSPTVMGGISSLLQAPVSLRT